MKNLTLITTLIVAAYAADTALLLPSLLGEARGGRAAYAQTNYTWNGSVSTSFTTAGNWTPSGVPGNGDNVTIVSTSNNPVLAATDTVNKLTITSGTLDLGGYNLRVQHQLTVSGSAMTNLRATNGRIINRTNQGSSISNCKMDCILDLQPGALTMTSVRATDSVLVLINASSTWKSNVFEEYVAIDKNTGTFISGSVTPDSFLVDLKLRILSTSSNEFAYLAYSSNANYVGGDLYLENLHTTNTANVQIGSSSDTTARLCAGGDVVLGNVGPSGSTMRLYGLKMTGGGTVRVGGTGFKSSTLLFTRCHLLGTDTLHLATRQSATVNFTKCTLYGLLRTDSATVNLDQAKLLAGAYCKPTGGNAFNATSSKFYGQTKILDGGLYISNYTYGPTRLYAKDYPLFTRYNHFTDSLYVTNQRTTGNTVLQGYLGADTLSIAVMTNTTSLAMSLNNSQYSHFNGDLYLNATSTGGYTFGNNLRITGNLELNTGSAGVSLGSTTHTGGGVSIGTNGYSNSTLSFSGYKHSGSGAFDLTGIGGSTAVTFTSASTVGGLLTATGLSSNTMNGCWFNGGASVSSGSLSVVNNRFYGTTSLTKTGSTSNYNYGNGFHGSTTLTQSSSSAGLYWSNSGRDTSFAALTLVCSGSQPHTIANAYDFIVMGDLTVNRTGSGVLTLAASNLNGKTRFEGSNDQTFRSIGANAPLLYKGVVNKSGGSLKLASELEVNNDITFTSGVVRTMGTGILKLRDNATATGASDASYVHGKVNKVGNDAFTYPVGEDGQYRPIAISAPSSTTAEFRAEYFHDDSDLPYPHSSRDASLHYLNHGEYWNLDRLVTTNTVYVTLGWEDVTCGLPKIDSMKVAAYNGTTWKDLGHGTTTGDTITGTVRTAAVSTVYGPFVLANYTALWADAGPDRIIAIGDTALIGTLGPDTWTYAWDHGATLIQDDTDTTGALPTDKTLYHLTVTGPQGCAVEDSAMVWVTVVPEDEGTSSLDFVTNAGQVIDTDGELRPDIFIYSHNASPMLYGMENKLAFVHAKVDTVAATPDTLARIDIQFEYTDRDAEPMGMGLNPHHYNYYYPHCPEGVTLTPTYNRVVYPELYENTDLHISGNNAWMKFDFVVRPGGDPYAITMRYEGAEDVVIVEQTGQLVITSSIGTYIFPKPKALKYDVDGDLIELGWQPDFELSVDGDTVRFINLGEYDEEEVLVLRLAEEPDTDPDPNHTGFNHQWHTAFGGQGDEACLDVTTDTDGNAVFVGFTNSMTAAVDGFPIQGQSIVQPLYGGLYDSFIAKFHVLEGNGTANNHGDDPRWVTYYGGPGNEQANAVVAKGSHESGSLFIAGKAQEGLEIDGTGFVQQYSGASDVFVLQLLSETGIRMWCTYAGGNANEEATSLALDGNDLFVAGTTSSNASGFSCGASTDGGMVLCPVGGAYNDDTNSNEDAFVLRFNTVSHTLTWGTFFGGTGYDRINCLEHDGTNLYAGGYTTSTSNFPVYEPDLNTYYQTANGGGGDGFVAVFGATLDREWVTYYGGDGNDEVKGMTIDNETPPNIFVVGSTTSADAAVSAEWCDAPTTGKFPLCDPGNEAYFQEEMNLGINNFRSDGFIAKFNSNYALEWGTYFGGEFNDEITDMDFFTPLGNVVIFNYPYIIVCGNTYSNDLPITTSPSDWDSNYMLTNYMNRPPFCNETVGDGFQELFLTSGKNLYGTTFVEPNDMNFIHERMNAVHSRDGAAMYIAGEVYRVTPPLLHDIFYHNGYWDYPYQYVDYNIAGEGDAYMTRFGYNGLGMSVEYPISFTNCIHVFPNPSTGLSTLQMNCGNVGVEELNLFSITGQVLFTSTLSSFDERIVIDLSHLPGGLYMLNVSLSDGSTQTLKLIRHGG